MARKKNLKIQMHQEIDSRLAIGESKHKAKQVYREYCLEKGLPYNPSKTEGIYSIGSASSYRQSVNAFSSWLKTNKNEVWSTKDLTSINGAVVKEYLQYRDKELSAYTVSKDMSALNKVLNLNLSKKECNLKERSYKNVTRSRGVKAHDNDYNAKNYKEQILIAKSFGLRRESILGGDYQVKDVSLFSKYGEVYVSVIEKGGRYREAICLEENKDIIKNTFNIEERESLSKDEFVDLYSSSDNLLFDKYTTKIDNHAFRAEYARELYSQLIKEQFYRNSSFYRGYVKDALQEVSENLGHNRLSVVVEHYLR